MTVWTKSRDNSRLFYAPHSVMAYHLPPSAATARDTRAGRAGLIDVLNYRSQSKKRKEPKT